MNRTFAVVAASGEVVQTLETSVKLDDIRARFEGYEVVEVRARPGQRYVDGEVEDIAPYHYFDADCGGWRLDLTLVWDAVRATRNERLAATDWVILRAADQGTPVPSEWLAYRQALRDVTEQGDPLTIIWPTPPT